MKKYGYRIIALLLSVGVGFSGEIGIISTKAEAIRKTGGGTSVSESNKEKSFKNKVVKTVKDYWFGTVCLTAVAIMSGIGYKIIKDKNQKIKELSNELRNRGEVADFEEGSVDTEPNFENRDVNLGISSVEVWSQEQDDEILELDRQNLELQRQAREIETLTIQCTELQEQLAAKETDQTELNEQLQAKVQEIETLSNQCTELQKQLRAKEAEQTELNEQLQAKVMEELTTRCTEFATRLQTTVDAKNTEIESLARKIERLNAEISNLKSAPTGTPETGENAQEIETLKAQCVALQEQLAAKEAEQTELNEQLRAKDQIMGELKNRYAEDLTQLQITLNEKNEKIESLNADISNFKSELMGTPEMLERAQKIPEIIKGFEDSMEEIMQFAVGRSAWNYVDKNSFKDESRRLMRDIVETYNELDDQLRKYCQLLFWECQHNDELTEQLNRKLSRRNRINIYVKQVKRLTLDITQLQVENENLRQQLAQKSEGVAS